MVHSGGIGVVDIGGFSAKFGCAGEELPCYTVPTTAGVRGDGDKVFGHRGLTLTNGTVTVCNPVHMHHLERAGEVCDVAAWTDLVVHGLEEMGISEATRLIFTVKSHSVQRDAIICSQIEALFSVLPSLKDVAIIRSAAAVCVASAKSDALVIESGHTLTSASPVLSSQVCVEAVHRTPFAGSVVSDNIAEAFSAKGIHEIIPQCQIERQPRANGDISIALHPIQASSFKEYCIQNTLREVKEMHCTVPLQHAAGSDAVVTLPDGQTAAFGTELKVLSDAMFHGQLGGEVEVPRLVGVSRAESGMLYCKPDVALPAFAAKALANVNGEEAVRAASNLLMVGGTANMKGFASRCAAEVAQATAHLTGRRSKGAAHTATMLPTENDPLFRLYSPFTGASIVAGWRGKDALWTTREQFDEVGKHAIDPFMW